MRRQTAATLTTRHPSPHRGGDANDAPGPRRTSRVGALPERGSRPMDAITEEETHDSAHQGGRVAVRDPARDDGHRRDREHVGTGGGRLQGRLRHHQPVGPRLRRERHAHEPRGLPQRVDGRLDVRLGSEDHPGVERDRDAVGQRGLGAEPGLQRLRRHRGHHELRLQRLVERLQPRPLAVHRQRHHLLRLRHAHPDADADADAHPDADPHRRPPAPPTPARPRSPSTASCVSAASTCATSTASRSSCAASARTASSGSRPATTRAPWTRSRTTGRPTSCASPCTSTRTATPPTPPDSRRR